MEKETFLVLLHVTQVLSFTAECRVCRAGPACMHVQSDHAVQSAAPSLIFVNETLSNVI